MPRGEPDVQVRALTTGFPPTEFQRIRRQRALSVVRSRNLRHVDAHRAIQAVAMKVDLVAVDVGGQRWALPLGAVERVVGMVAVSPLPESPAGIRGAINVAGEIVPVLDLDVRIGRPERDRGPDARLVLARTATRRVALPVDAVDGVIEVDDIAPPAEGIPAPIAGTAALPDGVLAIYDVDAFLTAADERQLDAVLAGGAS
jgi:purine-binding chemotaxis protein CheW